ncbi:leucine-rich repeat-containing protein 53 [Candoia aspera]|uniref:leucine-rich repeat-containing protein 53 n=1 Tax=Candoia aspera TaxID=51853 RepID=UPI002FD8324B
MKKAETKSALLILLAMLIHLIAPCPSSCMVCAEDVTLCQGLTYILAAPVSTQALIVTDGSITSVEGFNLSFLLNATLLSLSTNGIKTISDDAFLGLRTLKTLLLDQNQISSFSITYSTFHELQKLQVLVLSNNILSTIHGTWFKNTEALIRLHLNGNQLTSINADSFEMANLGNLRILDLSNNFINTIEKRAFHGLLQLMEIDLSRNRLALIPDTFSPLSQLKLLSLDQNWWNCTCKLYDLASFLRKYVNSSKILRNPENMNCRASENPSVTNLLELTEVNCKSALKQPPRILKGERKNYGRNTALVAVFSFVGGVGLTCLVLAFFNRKLQPGKANEHPSENCCCRVLDESQCGHESRNYLTKGYCNCHLTWENEIKVMSRLGAGEEMPYLQKNSHQETIKPECKCTGLKIPFGSIQSENEPMKKNHFLCLKCRLLQSFPQKSSGNIAVTNETELPLQKHFQRTQHSENSGQFEEDSLNARLKDDANFNQGIRSDTLQGRCSRPAHALAKEKLGECLANELCQSLSQTEYDGCFKSYKQRHLITALSSATDTPEESKEHCAQAALESHRSQCGFLARSRNISPQLDNLFICKYIDCDKNQDYPKVKEQNCGKSIRLEAEQSEAKGTRSGGYCVNAADIPLLPTIKKIKKPKQVSFYIPDLATIKRANVTTSGLSEKRFPQNKRCHEQIQRNQSPSWARLLSDSEAKIKERKPSSPLMGPHGEKENELIQNYKINMKIPNSLTVKLNLHPFRKGKIQPKELLHKKSLEQCSCGQPTRLLHTSKMEEKQKKRKKNSEYSMATQERFESSKDSICNRVAVEKISEETGKDVEISTSGSFNNSPALNIIKASSSTKHLQPPTTSPIFLVNRTSRMTVPIIPLSSGHSPNISPNITNNISTSLSSKKLKSDTSDTEVFFFHQNSLQRESKEKYHCLSPASLSQADNLDFQKSSSGDYMHSQQKMESIMHSMSVDHFGDQLLKGQNENLTRKDELVGQEKVNESESVQENLSGMKSQNFVEIPPSNAHQIISKKDANRLVSPVHLSTAFPNSQAIKEGLQINIREEDETTQQLRSDFKTESNSNLIPNAPMDSTGPKEEGAQTGDEWDNNKANALHKNIDKVAIISNAFSIPSSSETGSLYLNKNMDSPKNHNVHMDNDHNLQKNLDNPFDEDSTEHKEGKIPLPTNQEPPLLAEFKDVIYEQRTETSLLFCNINKAEISVPMSSPSPTSIDYNKVFPLQVEQSKSNSSNNTYVLP